MVVRLKTGLPGVRENNGTCSVATANAAMPEPAEVGAQGVLYRLHDHDSCASGATRLGTTTTRWSVEANGVWCCCA